MTVTNITEKCALHCYCARIATVLTFLVRQVLFPPDSLVLRTRRVRKLAHVSMNWKEERGCTDNFFCGKRRDEEKRRKEKKKPYL